MENKENDPKKDGGLKNLLVPLLLFVGVSVAAFLITYFILNALK
ncbi:hypothetical protein [Marinirhabdus gelatinilytica]|uniref:Uncharacterized protein n=1 Tax=Marinirhabdus gelatinilytica TaxID=1703343 RepID=A0A370QGH3_9FLAO|nr:hypothetical protein [Marinirhabdus gelatinilytica]RDK87389.1 hypothetical protein C8D94_102576 [Marinirhabdus gelatinilytica]